MSAAETAQGLAVSLAPALVEACNRRLGEISWFRTDWQRGGAATGTATYTFDDGSEAPVVVKLPVVQREFRWTARLQDEESVQPVVPRLLASGQSIAEYDLAWLIIERIPHGPLGLHWHEDHVPRIAEAIARFHLLASRFPVDQPGRNEDWSALVDDAAESVRINPVEHQKDWQQALKHLQAGLGTLVDEWESRPINQWLHGDAHVANAMSRVSEESGEVCLIDLAEVHAGHWVEDAVYLERQLWARPDRLKPHKPVRAVAAARKRLGLPVEPEDSRLAMIRRALLAGTAPAFMKSEGSPQHLQACLNWLQIALKELKL